MVQTELGRGRTLDHISSFHSLLPIMDACLFGVVLLLFIHCDTMHLSHVCETMCCKVFYTKQRK